MCISVYNIQIFVSTTNFTSFALMMMLLLLLILLLLLLLHIINYETYFNLSFSTVAANFSCVFCEDENEEIIMLKKLQKFLFSFFFSFATSKEQNLCALAE